MPDTILVSWSCYREFGVCIPWHTTVAVFEIWTIMIIVDQMLLMSAPGIPGSTPLVDDEDKSSLNILTDFHHHNYLS